MNIYDEIERVENLSYEEIDPREQELVEERYCEMLNECFEESDLQRQLSISNEELMRECRPYDYENGIEQEFYYMKEESIDEFRDNLEDLLIIFQSIFIDYNYIKIMNEFYFNEEDIEEEYIDLIEFNGKKDEVFDLIRDMKSLFLF